MKFLSSFVKYKSYLVALLVTVATFVFTDYCKNFLQSEAAFSKSLKSPDYILLDCYEGIDASNPVGVLNPDVVIVQDDECNRSQIALLIEAIDRMEPAAIGVDHVFEDSQPNDSLLTQAINRCQAPLVLASELTFDTECQQYTYANQCVFLDELDKVTWGVTNLDEPSVSPQNIIRRAFSTYVSAHGEVKNSLACELIRQSGMMDDKAAELPQKTYISYRGLSTEILGWKELIREDADSSEMADLHDAICGKIVLIGSSHDRADMHLIPSEKCIPGVEIHAAAIYTFVNQKYIAESPDWLNNLIAVICVFLFTLLLYYATVQMGRIGNLCVRLVQTVMIVLFILIGYIFYSSEQHPVYIDFSSSILMVGISAFVFDIIRGIYGLVLKALMITD